MCITLFIFIHHFQDKKETILYLTTAANHYKVKLTTEFLSGGWMPETSWSLHYWQPALRWRLHQWLAKHDNPVISSQAPEKTGTPHTNKKWKGGRGLGLGREGKNNGGRKNRDFSPTKCEVKSISVALF